MNTVNYYPTDNCGICTPFSPRVSSDVAFMWFNCADFDVFLSFPRSSCRSGDEYRHSQHRYGVRSQYGKWVIITPFSSLFLNMSRTNDKCNVCTCQGKYPPSPLGKPFALLLCGVLFVRLFVFLLFSWSHASTCESKANDRFCLRVDWVDPWGGLWSWAYDWIDSVASSTNKLTKQSNSWSKCGTNPFTNRKNNVLNRLW